MQRCRSLLVGATLLAVAATASACGDEPRQDLPTLGGSPSDETSPTDPTTAPSAAEPPKKGDKVDDDGYEVSPGRFPGSGPERKIARALVDYMTFRVASYNMASAHVGLPGVATGGALTDVETRAAELQQQGLRTVGALVVNVDEVTVSGDTATLAGCLENSTVDVDDEMRAVESPAPAYDVGVDAVRAGPTWLISSISFADAEGC